MREAYTVVIAAQGLAFRGREEDQGGQFFDDVVETMFDFCGNEKNASSGNLAVLIACAKARPAANDIVHFVFVMRALLIGCSGGEHVKTRAHAGYAKKLVVELAALRALLLDSGNVGDERFHARILHARMPAKTRSVNCGIRFWACRFPSGLYHW
jgi:hypothetical protein